MKVINKTNYDTNFLRSLFIKCDRHEGANPKYREVEVVYSRSFRIKGLAWFHSRYIVMKLPKRKTEGIIDYYTRERREEEKGADIHAVAQVYIHELGHNLGLRHGEMAGCGSFDMSWLGDNGIVPIKKIKPEKPKPNIVEVRANKAGRKLDEWMKKLNRAKTYVKKYQAKVKYYEKKMAANK